VGGEGLWSKAQKESLNSLLRYSVTFEPADYKRFQEELAVPLGDKRARLELEKADPDLRVAREGFLQGGNHPDDIEGMISLYRNFRQVPYMQRAIAIWTEADQLIERQRELGEAIHSRVIANPYGPATYPIIQPLVVEALKNDAELSRLEKQFSVTLGAASRQINELLFYTIFAFTLILGFGALLIALYILNLLKQVDTAKTEFVALASHQMRSPLSVITLSTELLRSLGAAHTPEEEEIVKNIEHEVVKMSSLVDSILNVSRIELGILVVRPEEIDLMAWAAAQLEMMELKAQQKKITLQGVYLPSELVVPIDPLLMQVVFQNLLANAIKYTAERGSITLTIERQAERILISIADTGHGIPDEERRHIFRKLYRASNAASLDPHGTGLGLYIVKSIITATNGSIWFESEEGVGTTFLVALPLTGMEPVREKDRVK
jgi:signal transduction histidine kinase